jgi:hypothetical protein
LTVTVAGANVYPLIAIDSLDGAATPGELEPVLAGELEPVLAGELEPVLAGELEPVLAGELEPQPARTAAAAIAGARARLDRTVCDMHSSTSLRRRWITRGSSLRPVPAYNGAGPSLSNPAGRSRRTEGSTSL